MKKRIISLAMAFMLVTPMFTIPKMPKIPNITNSITLPKVNIPTKYFEGIKLPVKVVL